MSLIGLTSAECGAPNPLVKLSAQIKRDTEQIQDGLRPTVRNLENGKYFPIERLDHEQLCDEYMGHQGHHMLNAPRTFDMQAILQEMLEIERPDATVRSPLVHSQDVLTRDWIAEYQPFIQDADVGVSQHKDWVHEYQRGAIGVSLPVVDTTTSFTDAQAKWAHEYLEEYTASYHSPQRLADLESSCKTSHQLLDEVADRIEVQESRPTADVEEVAEGWAREFQEIEKQQVEMADEWRSEFALDKQDLDYWEKLKNEWDEMFSESLLDDASVAKDVQAEKYEFEQDNPFTGCQDAFEEGLRKYKLGDLISAILLFEEAVNADPNHAEAWQYLGTCQAENEQEKLAILALSRCLDLQPDNLTARLALAVSYTNESLQTQACDSLRAWIEHHPRYSHLVTRTASMQRSARSAYLSSSIIDREVFDELHDLYLAAARLSPDGNIDADIQTGLGVLFNISGDYEKAIDCFETGLQARPDSPQLWNRLGATMANSGRSDEAVSAYTKALELSPGFIRCRYNLGISCINLKAYAQAVEHFLVALSMQRKGEDPSRKASTMSESIWSTLRMSVSLLGRLELMQAVQARDLDRLCAEFLAPDQPL